MSAEAMTQIEHQLPRLSREEKLHLVGLLTKQLQEEGPRQTVHLEGMWKDEVPEDFDIDKALQEIRGEWMQELDWVEQDEREEESTDG